MRLLFWGAGAIGGTVGAYLARAGHEVVWVDTVDEHVQAINEQGMHISGSIDTFTVQAPAYTPADLEGTFDTILLCTKAQHTEAACHALAPHLSPNGCVVSLQNGLNERTIAAIVGSERTVGAFVNFGADYLEPAHIHYGGRGAVVLGELDGQKTERLSALHRAFLEFDANAIITPNIWGYLWSKLAVGTMLFATSLTNESIADALASEGHREVFLEIPREVLRVAQAQGVTPEPFNGFNPTSFLPGADDAAARVSLEEMVAFNRRSAKTHSGIWRDLAVRKRRTEVDPQLQPIVTLGAEAGLRTPLTETIIHFIHEIEDGVREQDMSNLDLLLETLKTPTLESHAD